MKRIALCLILICVFACGLPSEARLPQRLDAYSPARSWRPGECMVDTVAGCDWTATVRVGTADGRRLELGLHAGTIYVGMQTAGTFDDELTGAPLRLTVRQGDSLLLSTDVQKGLDPRADVYTLSVSREGNVLLVEAARGATDAAGCFEVRLPQTDCTDTLSFTTAVPCSLHERRLTLTRLPRVERARFETEAELDAYLQASTDPREGYWVYLDRDTRPAHCTLGGDYRLATVGDGRGGYDIVYLSGAGLHAAAWAPLRLKGHLRPTAFISNYDLEWIQPDGTVLSTDCSAELTDGALLTLRFPTASATVRYRKALPKQRTEVR